MVNLLESGYTAFESKRFQISKDAFSQERFAAVVTTVQDLREMYHFVVGATLFGSLAGGKKLTTKTAIKSDIDLVIFIDRDELVVDSGSFTQNNENFERWRNFFIKNENGPSKSNKINEEKITLQATKFCIKELAENMIRSKLSINNQLPEYVGLSTKSISLTGQCSMYENLLRVYEYILHKLISDSGINPSIGLVFLLDIASPWALDIDNGLVKYRQAFLNQLQQLDPDSRDLYWKAIHFCIKFTEKNYKNSEKIVTADFPETIEDAVRIYGLSE